MAQVSDWSTVEVNNTHLDELTLSGEGALYTNKLMCAIKKKFDSVDSGLGNAVHKTGDEAISGEKIFAGSIVTKTGISICSDGFEKGVAPSSTKWLNINYCDKNGHTSYTDNVIGSVSTTVYASNIVETGIRALRNERGTSDACAVLCFYDTSNNNRYINVYCGSFQPASESYPTLGAAGVYRWGNIYSTSATITTSDERQKQSISFIPDKVLDVWGSCDFLQYKMNRSVETKGLDKARLHTGMVAQNIKSAFDSENINIEEYGLFCHDVRDAVPAEYDENGRQIREGVEAVDEYSLRYEEALCMEAAFQRRRADRAEARIADLESRLAALEDRLNGV